jgi:hypothetical protein
MDSTNYVAYNPDPDATGNNPEDGRGDNFNNEVEGNCNLIVNYLPYDVDDITLRVSYR